jgi:hypothetical protein
MLTGSSANTKTPVWFEFIFEKQINRPHRNEGRSTNKNNTVFSTGETHQHAKLSLSKTIRNEINSGVGQLAVRIPTSIKPFRLTHRITKLSFRLTIISISAHQMTESRRQISELQL